MSVDYAIFIFEIGKTATFSACLLDRALWRPACRSRRVDRYLSGVGCQIMWCSVSGIASPVERAEGVHDGRARVTIACLLQMQCQTKMA